MIELYCPEIWENMEGMGVDESFIDDKDFTSGKPFFFYCLDNQIQIIKCRDDFDRMMTSLEGCLMGFFLGFLYFCF